MVSSVNGNIMQEGKIPNYIAENPKCTNAIKGTVASETADNSNSFKICAGMGVLSTAVFEGVPFALYLKRNKQLNGSLTQDMFELSNSTQKSWNNIFNGNGKVTDRIAKYFNVVNNNFSAYSEIRSKAKAKVNLSDATEKAVKAREKASKNPGILNRNVRNAVKAEKKALELAEKATKKITAGLEEKLSFSKLMKLSSARAQLGFVGVIELVLDVIPTFWELGFEKGVKQLGKSTVKTVANVASFIAGQQAGMAVGSAIGTAICPGAGTFIGGAVGLLTGFLTSYGADKITEKIVGKPELELAKEEQEKNNKILNSQEYNEQQMNNNPFII